MKEYRDIPGFEGYTISNDGAVMGKAGKLLSQYMFDGYYYVEPTIDGVTLSQRVSRLVGYAWVENHDPDTFTIINHIDGCKTNNHYSNLEWTTYSGNNYHAVANGLRSDAIAAYVREFSTGKVFEFPSIAQAVEFMGLRKDSAPYQYYPKMFGKLVNGNYEFRYKGDDAPWFYENRSLISPTRYLIVVHHPDGTIEEISSRKKLYKLYQLYRCPATDIPSIVEYANAVLPHLRFVLRDSYTEPRCEVSRIGKLSIRTQVIAKYDAVVHMFESLTKCANHFEVDRSVIQHRIKTGTNLDGWILTQPDHEGTHD